MLNIILHTPKIPQNTGNIGRLTAANHLKLHLIEPLGFEITDKNLRRAGLDYWKYVDITQYASWEDFLNKVKPSLDRLHILSTKGTKLIYENKFEKNDYLVFGDEERGLPQFFHDLYPDKRFKIPIKEPGVRSLNLANSVAIVCFEAIRQIEYAGV